MKASLMLITALAVLSGCSALGKLAGNTVSGDYDLVCTFAKDGKLIGQAGAKASCPQAADGSLDVENCDIKAEVK